MTPDDVLQKIYEEHLTQARHHESLRERITAMILALGAALLAFQGSISAASHKPFLGWLLVGLGLFGALTSLKHYERNRFHVAVARALRMQMEQLLEVRLEETRRAAQREHNERHPILHRIRLYYLWLLPHLALVLVGLFVAT